MSYLVVGAEVPIKGMIFGARKTAAEALALARAARRELGEVRILDEGGSEISESKLRAKAEREPTEPTANG